jgi:hypothetical protein
MTDKLKAETGGANTGACPDSPAAGEGCGCGCGGECQCGGGSGCGGDCQCGGRASVAADVRGAAENQSAG